jgi:hypothetical protein
MAMGALIPLKLQRSARVFRREHAQTGIVVLSFADFIRKSRLSMSGSAWKRRFSRVTT